MTRRGEATYMYALRVVLVCLLPFTKFLLRILKYFTVQTRSQRGFGHIVSSQHRPSTFKIDSIFVFLTPLTSSQRRCSLSRGPSPTAALRSRESPPPRPPLRQSAAAPRQPEGYILWSPRRAGVQLNHFIPDLLTYSVAYPLKRLKQSDVTLYGNLE